LIRPATFTEDGHIYSENGIVVPSVTQVCEGVGLYSTEWIKDDWKAGLGTEVHYLTALLDRGENLDEYEFDQRCLPYLDSYRELKAVQKFTWYVIEYGPGITDVNGMPVGFRMDRAGVWDGMETIGEIKCTSADIPYHGVQLAGYDLCMGEIKRQRLVIRLQGDGKCAKVKPYTDPSEYGVFGWALALTHWKGNHKV